jgi:hypothetical protein
MTTETPASKYALDHSGPVYRDLTNLGLRTTAKAKQHALGVLDAAIEEAYRAGHEAQRGEGIVSLLLEATFGDEWTDLNDHTRRLVRTDYMHAADSENIGGREYLRRIGSGNLSSYADCLKAREDSPRQ